ncbi:MAG: NUDIX domain-containing protein [Anaerolineales bacterium]|nr:NUDIX domain-containing protein [Anaerolineales bacterium]
MSPFKININRYGGVFVDPDSLPDKPHTFRKWLEDALLVWKKAGHVSVWLEVPEERAYLIQTAVDLGFSFHNAHGHTLTLNCRLLPNAVLPDDASHYLGAGGIVINEANELLVIREKYHNAPPGMYKLPGGFVQAGENIADAVVREVWEETGVEAVFQSLVCFRHWHVNRFRKSDIYVVCRLTPTTSAIVTQEEEIAECRWMPVDEFLNHEDVSMFNKGVVETAVTQTGFVSRWFVPPTDPTFAQKYELFLPPANNQKKNV